MENNIFEGAKFGDKFVTRDGKLALFDKAYDNNRYSLFVQDVYGNIGYHGDGTLCGNISSDKEIVSRYEEPIEDEVLKDALYDFVDENFIIHTSEGDYDYGEQTIEYYSDRTYKDSKHVDKWGIVDDFMEYYKKAKEDDK